MKSCLMFKTQGMNERKSLDKLLTFEISFGWLVCLSSGQDWTGQDTSVEINFKLTNKSCSHGNHAFY